MLSERSDIIWFMIEKMFAGKENVILHLHTLNLIYLAKFIREKINWKIISHLHCIPWKGRMNSNEKAFNYLCEIPLSEKHITKECETLSYNDSDEIVCVTNSGVDFINAVSTPKPIKMIYNGINDSAADFNREFKEKGNFKILFVGSPSKGKGFYLAVEAVTKVRGKGFDVSLDVAGAIPEIIKNQIGVKLKGVNFLGNLTFEQLSECYKKSDIGIIASLQEQCSYASIEMMMFGLPTIYSDIDGLNETLSEECGLPVPTVFTKNFGLKLDTDIIADGIIKLIENKDLRQRLSCNARKRYLEKFTCKEMIKETYNIYKQLIN
jgi:glycosyltransferase involved in cell wall biosynthesis